MAAPGMIIRALFAAAIQAGADIVHGLHHQVVFSPWPDRFGQIDGEGRRAAVVPGYFRAIDVDGGNLIHSTEMQQNSAAGPFLGDGNDPMVKDCGNEIPVCDAGELAFRRKGNEYLLLEGGGMLPALGDSAQAEIKAISPPAIQVDPGGAEELGARMLRTGLGSRHRHVLVRKKGRWQGLTESSAPRRHRRRLGVP